MTNLRLINAYQEDGGKWINANEKTVIYAQKLLAEYREAEPKNDWRLETCGTSADWHRFVDARSA